MRNGLLVAGCVAASAVLAVATSGYAAAATAAAAAAAVATAVNPCTATAAYAAEVTAAGKVAWRVSLPAGQSQGLPSPVVSKGVAVFADNNDLVGLRAADGRRLWDDHLRPNDPVQGDLRGLWLWAGNAIALIANSATDWRLVAVNPANGKVRWQVKFGAAVDIWSGISPDGLFALTAGEKLYVLNLATGHALWSRPVVKTGAHATYAAELVTTDGVLVSDFLQLGPEAPSVLVGYNAKTGHQLWAKTGQPEISTLGADGGVVLISGVNDGKDSEVPTPLTAFSAANGKTLWHAAVGFFYDLWTQPGHAVFGSQAGMYDVNPVTGAKRWEVPGENSTPNGPSELLLTNTDAVYFHNGGSLTDRRLSNGTVAWQQPGAPRGSGSTFIVAPRGPNALVAGGNNWDYAPQTVVSTVNLRTGKLVAQVTLPSDLPAAPAVTGSDAIYELNPEFCVSG
jgi:outer membrane protein assembly factor BamB